MSTGGSVGLGGSGGLGGTGGTGRLGALLRAEFTKISTLPATWIALVIAVAANTLLGIAAAADVVRIAGRDGPVPLGQLGTLMIAPVYVFVAITVFAAGSEYRGGQLRVSLAAVPDRHRLCTAKLAAAAVVGLLAAVPAVVPGYLIRHAAASTHGQGATGPLTLGGALGDLSAQLGAYLLLSVLGSGFALIARSVVTPLAVLFMTPVLISPPLWSVAPQVVRFLPHEATLSLLNLAGDHGAALGRTGGLLTLTGWVSLFIGLAWALVARRDS